MIARRRCRWLALVLLGRRKLRPRRLRSLNVLSGVVLLIVSGCGRVVNDARLVSPNDTYDPSSGRSIVIVGVGVESATPPGHPIFVFINGDYECWLVTNVILSAIRAKYSANENGIARFLFNVKPGIYYMSRFVRSPYGSQAARSKAISIAITVPPSRIVYVGDYVYRGVIVLSRLPRRSRKSRCYP